MPDRGDERLPADAAALGPSAVPGPTVLIVDDNIRLARTTAAFMEMEGFVCRAAYSAEDALRAVAEMPFDVAVIDINMPGMDGIQVCRRIGATAARVRILMLTGRDVGDDEQKAVAAGARRLLLKPIALADLRDEIRRVMSE